MNINIEIMYAPEIQRKLVDLMIEGRGFTAITKNGVKIQYRDYDGQIPFRVSVRGRPDMRMAGEFLSEKFGSQIEEAICFAAAPAFRQALENEASFDLFLKDLHKQEALRKRKAEEAERLARVKRLLTPEQEAQIADAFRGIEKECVRGGGWIDECISTSVGEVAVDTFRAMGYMEIADMFERFIPYRIKNRKPVVTPVLPTSTKP